MTIEKNKTYDFKKEFWPAVGINKGQWENRKADLLNWISNFFDYELQEGRPIRIHIFEVFGEYQPLPRKVNSTELTQQKQEDYKNFAIASLGTEFKPNSKAKTSREAIFAFGHDKYGHTNVKAVAERYVGPVFDEYGECNNIKRWVWYSTYEPLDNDTLNKWRAIMAEEHISEQEAANAFYRQEQGEDISREQGYFRNAREHFKAEFGEAPILVADWKLKKDEECALP